MNRRLPVIALASVMCAVFVQAQAPTGRISGRVVAAHTGQPLQRAIVTLNGAKADRVIADAEGRYEFTGLPAGSFTVRAGKTGYVTNYFGQPGAFQPGTPVALASGQRADGIDIRLPRGGVIAVRVTDGFGEPLAGAQIQVQRFRYTASGERMLGDNFTSSDLPTPPLTDDRGESRAYGLPAGEYVVSATFRPLTSEQVFYPGTPSAEAALPVSLVEGQEALIQFPIAVQQVARLSGVAADSQGRPAAGARVRLFRFAVGSGLRATETVAADGTFAFADVAPGEHYIDVSTRDGEYTSMRLAVTGVDLSGLHLVTSAGATISGRVVFDGGRAPVLKNPIRVMPDQVDSSVGTVSGAPTADTLRNGAVDAEGRFRLTGVIGRVLFRMVLGTPDWVISSVTLDGRAITDEPLDVSSGAPVSGVVITLTDRLTTIAGRVTDAEDAAPRHSVVVLVPAGDLSPDTVRRLTRVVRPNAGGRFELRAMRPGRYLAAAIESLEDGEQYAPAFQDRIRRTAREFTVGEGETVSLDLRLAVER